MPLDQHLVEERRVADQPGAAVDAQGVAAAGDEEVQPDVRVLQDVLVAVGPLVARPLGERDRVVVDDVHQLAGRVALRRGVALTGRRRRRQHAERRGREPVTVDVEQRRTALVAGALVGLTEQADEVVDGRDLGPGRAGVAVGTPQRYAGRHLRFDAPPSLHLRRDGPARRPRSAGLRGPNSMPVAAPISWVPVKMSS